MSLSAALLLAAAAAAPTHDEQPRSAVVLAEARVTARIMPGVSVRQHGGLQQGDPTAPRPQLSRRGRTILFEFE